MSAKNSEAAAVKSKRRYLLISGLMWLAIAAFGYAFDPEHMLVVYSLVVLGVIELVLYFALK
jgi:hypothetical protein